MDYTIAQYKSPDYEELAFQIFRDRLIDIGYAEELCTFTYEPSFPIRGLWFDTLYGTFLKLDQFSNVLVCLRGFNVIPRSESMKMYPNKFSKYDELRIVIMDTLISQGELRKKTMEDLDRYIEKNKDLPLLLDKLCSRGRMVFLLTNSDFTYSQAVMKYLSEEPCDAKGKIRPWTSYFDFILTDAKKPLFFDEGTLLRAVDETGRLSLGHHIGPLQTGKIYSGDVVNESTCGVDFLQGSCEVFTQLIGARGKDVLYTGDHIFGAILRSKKKVGWRTFLIIPELTNEIYVWKTKKDLFDRLQCLDNKLADAYKDMDIETSEQPDVNSIRREIQTMRYADIYSFSCFNLLYYPLCYMFRAPTMFMPHESTVPHAEPKIGSFADLEETPCSLRRRSYAISASSHSFVCPEVCLKAKGIINSNLVDEITDEGGETLSDPGDVE
ncbi:hypothetical protein Aperf_G00000122135 [Anoplocephala perfoliata]